MLSVRRRQEDAARGVVGARGAAAAVGAGGMEDDAELEEGEACGDETAFVDPDVALSYLDEKLQDVLGHFQKDFEGGVSAENLGSKFGGYGSFLPTYQRSPLPQTLSPPKVARLSSRSPYHQSTEGTSQNPSTVAAPSVSHNNGSVVPILSSSSRKETCQSTKAERGSSTHDSSYEPSKCSDQNRFKVRIKVGSENVLPRNNADIYSGLGLDISSPSSVEDSPNGCGTLSPEFSNVPLESPRTIIKIMTCFSIPGGFLLSPLHSDVLQLAKKVVPPSKKWERVVDIENVNGTYEDHVNKKMKPYGKKKKSVDMMRSRNKNHSTLVKEEIDIETPAGQRIVSEALSIPLLSDSQTTQTKVESQFEEESIANSLEGNKSAQLKERTINSDLMPIKGETVKAEVTECLEKSGFGSSEMDFSGGKGELKPNTEKMETSLAERITNNDKTFLLDKKQEKQVKPDNKCNIAGVNFEDSKVINERDPAVSRTMEKVPSKETLLYDMNGENKTKSEAKRMAREQKMNVSTSADFLQDDKGARSSSAVKERKNDSQSKSSHSGKKHKAKSHRDVRDNLPDGSHGGKEQDILENGGLGELRPKEKSYKNGSERDYEMPGTSKREILNAKHDRNSTSEDQKMHIPASASISTTNAAPALAAPVVIEEHWVCCDICQKWRLLPYEWDPSTLPKKWNCSMLSWLPGTGMNRCDVSEDETTNALNALYVIPAPTSSGITSLGHPHVAPAGLESASTFIINGNVEQGRKRKNAPSDGSALIDGSHSTQASGYPMGNQHAPARSKTTADGNQYSIEKDSVSKSVDPFAEKKRSKSKNRGSYSDGGDLMERPKKHSKVNSKREMDHDEYKTSKKGKKEERYHSGRDRNPECNLATGDDEAKSLPAKAVIVKSLGERSDISSSKQKHIPRYNPLEKSKRAKDEDIVLPEDETKEHIHPSDVERPDLSSKKRIVKEWEESQHNSTTQVSKGSTLNHSSAAKETYKDQNLKETKPKLTKSEALFSSTDSRSVKRLHPNQVLSHNGVHLNSELVEDSTTFAGKKGLPELLESRTSEQILDLAAPASSDAAYFQTTAVTSSSSKASDSQKKKHNSQIAKTSPIESVSSSPSRNNDKLSHNRLLGKDGSLNANSSTTTSSAKYLNTEVAIVDNVRQARKSQDSLLPNESILHGSLQVNSDNDDAPVQLTQGHATDGISLERGLDDELQHASGRKDSAVKGSITRGYNHADKNSSHTDGSSVQPRTGVLDTKGDLIVHENKRSVSSLQDKNGSNHYSPDGNPQREMPPVKEKLYPKSNKQDAQKLKPQTLLSPLKESKMESHSNSTQVKSNASKLASPLTRCSVENVGQHNFARQTISNPAETSSPARKDGNLTAYALKEARDLKHKANRLKEEGKELESTRLYFEAALKYLHAASLLEPPNIDGLKQGDQAQNLYSDTAKLCNFVGHAYEKCKNMAAAALAYKCVEVAYLKAAYYKFPTANKDRQVLQAVVQATPGESPSSSASDIDNLNNGGLTKAGSSKEANSPQVAGSQLLLAVRNQPHLTRLLAYTNDVNCAFDATRKSQMAIASAAGNDKKGIDGLSSDSMMCCRLTILMGRGQQCQLIVLTKKSASGGSFQSRQNAMSSRKFKQVSKKRSLGLSSVYQHCTKIFMYDRLTLSFIINTTNVTSTCSCIYFSKAEISVITCWYTCVTPFKCLVIIIMLAICFCNFTAIFVNFIASCFY